MSQINEGITFPQFRKYKNGKSYFKVTSREEFEEIRQQPGGKWTITHFKARILPDRNFILDLTQHYESHWDKIEEEEYESLKRQALD